ncbi:hypothetical protein G9A89_003695 [Geosiphon pyriformis]|nr:hypothetical protein G9A89_003695 [Geosiphon pyriformis]
MEKLQIKKNRPKDHNCKKCSLCQESIKNKTYNDCKACQFLFFRRLYKEFSSGNKTVDEIIKNPIYIPGRNNNQRDNFYRIEWIPWDRLRNVSKIGQGGFGNIYKATWVGSWINFINVHNGKMEYERKGPKEVAIKFMSSPLQNNLELFKEINIQRAMLISTRYISFITEIYGITQNPQTLDFGFVMELAEHGDMRKYLLSNFHSTFWDNKLNLAWNIAEGLNLIHSAGMIHCDLHSGNILQLSNERVKIGDLGLSKPANREAADEEIFGVIPYIPPEVLKGEKFTTAGDIYSLGMLLWELATGKPPFYDRPHNDSLVIDILNGKRPKITAPFIPPCIAEIIEQCWEANPSNRPTANEVLKKLVELLRVRNYSSPTKSLESLQFLKSDKLIKESVEYVACDETPKRSSKFSKFIKFLKKLMKCSKKKNSSKKSAKKSPINIHQRAVYTSRSLTLQMTDVSKGSTEFVYLPKETPNESI